MAKGWKWSPKAKKAASERAKVRFADPQERAKLAESQRAGLASDPSRKAALVASAHAARKHRRPPQEHGMSKAPEYVAWGAIVQRCTNPKATGFADYGGRGITVDPAWVGRGGFAAFFACVGLKPSPAHTIGRIDNDRGYTPGNVRWETRTEQGANTRKIRKVTIGGVTKHLAAWARDAGITPPTLAGRIARGWPEAELLRPGK